MLFRKDYLIKLWIYNEEIPYGASFSSSLIEEQNDAEERGFNESERFLGVLGATAEVTEGFIDLLSSEVV